MRRNPITGEEIIMNPGNNGTENNEKEVVDETEETNDKEENGG